ncbi:MAG: hypothetical protein HQL30_12935, partial [Candidatus Omnitrophica bacterium]|nr:hypothetical protein [Candidatus Omnitrophota bacterium]
SDQPFNSSVENIGELLSQEGNICFSTDVDITVQGGITAEGGVDILALNTNVTIPEGVTIRSNNGDLNIEPGKGDINIEGLVAAEKGEVRLWTCGNIDLRNGDVKSKNGGFVYNPEDAISVSWTGGGNGSSWEDGSNWSGGNSPNGQSYNVTIDLNGANVSLGTSLTIGGLTVGTNNTCSLALNCSIHISEADAALDGDLAIGAYGTVVASDYLTIEGTTIISGILEIKQGGGIISFGNGNGADSLNISGTVIIEKISNGGILLNLGGSPSISGTIKYQAVNQANMDLICWGATVHYLTINSHASSVYTASSNINEISWLTVTSGTLDMGSYDLNIDTISVNGGILDLSDPSCDVEVSGAISVTSGTLKAPAAADDTSFLVGTYWEVSGTGTFIHNNGRVVFVDGFITGVNGIITSSSNECDFYDLKISRPNGGVLLEDALVVLNDLIIDQGSFDVNAGENNTLTVGGDFQEGIAASFMCRQGRVVINGSGTSNIISGHSAMSFYDFECVTASKTLVFTSGATYYVSHTLTLNGQADGTKINIQASGSGSKAILEISSNQTVSYVSVKDSEVSSQGGTFNITANNSAEVSGTDSGEAAPHWIFAATAYDISGTVYSDLGVTALSGVSIGLIINGTYQGSDQTTNGSGVFTFSGIAWNNGDLVMVFINGNAVKGNTVTKVAAANVSGLDIWGETLIVRYETGASITNANLATALGAYSDNDILFSLDGSNNLDINGSLKIWTGKNYAPGADINIEDNFINSGIFTHGNKRVTFDGGAAGYYITSNGSGFYDVTVNGAGGGWTAINNISIENSFMVTNGSLDMNTLDLDLNGNITVNGGTLDLSDLQCDVDIDGNVVVTSGTLKAPAIADDTSFLVGGSWEVSGTGTFTHGNGRVVFDSAAQGKTIITSSSNADDFYQVKFNGIGGEWALSDGLAVQDDLSIVNGTFDCSTHDLTVNGDLGINGGELIAPSGSLTISGNFDHAGGS